MPIALHAFGIPGFPPRVFTLLLDLLKHEEPRRAVQQTRSQGYPMVLSAKLNILLMWQVDMTVEHELSC